jgi:phosphoglycerate dehydrogenase-like enzyme
MPARVVILDDYQDVARRFGPWDRLGDRIELTVLTEHITDTDVLADTLAGAEIVVAMRERTPFPRGLLERLDDLRLLVTTGRRNASIDVAAARDEGIVVSGTGIPARPTTELTWGLILSLVRHIPQEDARLRAGGWQHTVGNDLAGRTLGVIGLGRQGSGVATVGLAFEMNVIAWSQNLQAEDAAAIGVTAVTKDELLATADVVTLHLVLSDRSRGTIGAAELAAMKRSAYLVNTSRGPLVDEQALLAALNDGIIAGAALDVYDEEPLPADHPLRSAPNTVLTPHLGYVSEGTYEIFYGDAVEDIQAYLDGAPIRVIEPG